MIDIKFNELLEKFDEKKTPINFDFRTKIINEISNHYKDGKKYLHYIHRYPGRVAPHIPFALLSLKDFKKLDGIVLDPFAGTGTVLLESIANPFIRRNAYGVEINPLARLISKTKTTCYNLNDLSEGFNKIQKTYLSLTKHDFENTEFLNIDLWFSKYTIKNLSKLKSAIEVQEFNDDIKDFFWVCFSKIVRKVSFADSRIPPPVVLKPEKYKKNKLVYKKLLQYLNYAQKPNIWKQFEQAFVENSKLASYNGQDLLYKDKITARIISDDAMDLKLKKLKGLGSFNISKNKLLPHDSIDLVITSPPYLTAQKYIRSVKLELLWLGFKQSELAAFEKSTVGTEYVTGEINIKEFFVEDIDTLINWTNKKSAGRASMVFKYFDSMKIVLQELFRVLKSNSYAIFIMGDNTILNRKVNTYDLLSSLAKSIGFEEVLILKDLIRNRSMITSRNGTGGLIKNEYIIILKKQ
ncbi:MAG: hypothetical protein WAU11_16260 [Ignavibacteriaceae bacterium]